MMALKTDMPQTIAGFETINRYWDNTRQSWVAKILPGEIYVSRGAGELIATTLGSCIAACIRDPVTGVAGMNHFMLPSVSDGTSQDWKNHATRYGSYAMEVLINEILKAGGKRKNLEMKVCGGGKIIDGISNDIGHQNSDFVLDYAKVEGIPVIAYDLGDIYPRKLMYYPATGQMFIKRIQHLYNDTILVRESQYHERLKETPHSGGVELFE